MTLTELIAKVGLENILVQRVDQSLVGISTNKKGVSRITFETEQLTASDFMRGTGSMHGLIVWIPRDKIPTAEAGSDNQRKLPLPHV